jgi:tRNA threonylcarbamoyladenosine biosynthesis protein TsaB
LKILAVETSTELCSAALWLDGVVHAVEAAAGQRHSELLLPMVGELLADHGLQPGHLDGVAFGAGPGSFTGLRIACGVAQGIAFGAGLPVVGVATLLALAERSGAAHALCCLDARMGEIYHAAYVRGADDWITVSEPALCRPEAAPALPGERWTGCGSGFITHAAALANRYGSQLACAEAELAPHAREVAVLAARQFRSGKGVAPELAAPLYLRDKVALRVDER